MTGILGDRPTVEVLERRQRLREAMIDRSIDAVVIASEGNFLYLTGYYTNSWGNRSRPIVLVIGREGPATVVLSAGEAESVLRNGTDVVVQPFLQPTVHAEQSYSELEFMVAAGHQVAEALDALGVRSVGLELSSHFLPGLSPRSIEYLRERLAGTRIVDASPMLWMLRECKSDWEIAQLRRTGAVLGATYQRFEEEAHPGLSERELHRLFTSTAALSGADRVGYTCIVAGAERGPLSGPTDRVWESGQLLLVDAGVSVAGYWADYSRVYGGGRATVEQVDCYEAIVRALQAGRSAVRAGTPAANVAWALIGRKAATDQAVFGRVGHGVGLDITEPPSLHPDETNPLRLSMTLCIEPTRVAPRVGHLVGEEEVVVTEHGHELISPPFPSELKVLG